MNIRRTNRLKKGATYRVVFEALDIYLSARKKYVLEKGRYPLTRGERIGNPRPKPKGGSRWRTPIRCEATGVFEDWNPNYLGFRDLDGDRLWVARKELVRIKQVAPPPDEHKVPKKTSKDLPARVPVSR